MKQINIDFEKYDGGLDNLINSSSEGDMYLLQMADKEEIDKVKIMFCEVHKIMNGMIGIINGHFSTEYSFMELIGVLKVVRNEKE